jgi:hypothetical protein
VLTRLDGVSPYRKTEQRRASAPLAASDKLAGDAPALQNQNYHACNLEGQPEIDSSPRPGGRVAPEDEDVIDGAVGAERDCARKVGGRSQLPKIVAAESKIETIKPMRTPVMMPKRGEEARG